MIQMKKLTLTAGEVSYQIFGEPPVSLVIEMGLGASAGEWWHIAQRFSKKHTILLYERIRESDRPRTPRNIASELYELLNKLSCKEKVILLAHSQGGLYAQQFTRLHPELVRGLILIDPLSANDNRYKELLTPEEQKRSGFDKSAGLIQMKRLAKLHLGFVIKAVMKKAPPFFYYDAFSKEAADSILQALTEPSFHASALEEYHLAHEESELAALKTKAGFPPVPLVLITHSSDFEIKEIMEFGRATYECAQKVESIWQSFMQEYLKFSDVSRLIRAEHSGHYIHLTEPDIMEEAAAWIEKAENRE